MKTMGLIAMAIGAVVGLYALNMDVTVDPGLGMRRVVNISLMSHRQNLLIVGGVMAIIGAVLFGFGSQRRPPPTNGEPLSEADAIRAREDAQRKELFWPGDHKQ